MAAKGGEERRLGFKEKGEGRREKDGGVARREAKRGEERRREAKRGEERNGESDWRVTEGDREV
jgi:hypothetical protein